MNIQSREDYLNFGNLDSILDEKLELGLRSKRDLIEHISLMLQIRMVEQKIAEMRKTGIIGGPVHLGAGQEAIAVGISKFLRRSDFIFSGHRSHAHLLALNSDPYKLFAEVLGKLTGLTKGMGGSMHLWDGQNGFHGSVPIVAGTVPLAVGAALGLKMQNRDDIAVAYFGDGAIEEGVIHESLNLARQLKVPILFVCENNLFSSHMHISQRQPLKSVSRFSVANDIQTEVVDGNNVLRVEIAAEKLINSARQNKLPVFIEALTYRHYGHVDWQVDIDVGINRSQKDLEIWKKRDPILRLKSALFEANLMSESELIEITQRMNSQIEFAWQKAVQDLEPESKDLFKHVYKA